MTQNTSTSTVVNAVAPRTVRAVDRVFGALPASDGDGVKLNRIIGRPGLSELDPFLLLDEFRSDDAADYIGGFPNHPHRGFETVTYMLAGRMRHGDNQGNVGLLRPGSVQWMTAGRGIVHSEMPEQENGLLQGFQLWVNLPAKDKMTAPRYQDIDPEKISTVDVGGVNVKVLAGKVGDVKGAVDTGATDPTYLDVHLPARSSFAQPVKAGYNAFVYVYDGEAAIGAGASAKTLKCSELGVLSEGGEIRVAAGAAPARLLIIAGKPLGEPVARYGPFVMNTMAEIRKAAEDYAAGRF
ncbi:MAG TPA: pirin family protein [Burkholderiales bacterium]|nr:pirin family protein [Burkholderiales bacterium]